MSLKNRETSEVKLEDRSRLLLSLVTFQKNLDETDEDLSPELSPALQESCEAFQRVDQVNQFLIDRIPTDTCTHVFLSC